MVREIKGLPQTHIYCELIPTAVSTVSKLVELGYHRSHFDSNIPGRLDYGEDNGMLICFLTMAF